MLKNNGLTLIELMVALTLGSILLSVIMTIFLLAEKYFDWQMKWHQLQDHVHFTFEFLQKNLNLAGYIGCAKLTADFPIKNHTEFVMTAENVVVGTDHNVTIYFADLNHAILTRAMTDFSTLTISANPQFVVGDILIISDCKTADIFRVEEVTHAEGQKIRSSFALSKNYSEQAEVSRLNINTFFIDKTDRVSLRGKPIFSLFRKDTHHQKMELVEGVNHMQVSFDKKNGKKTGVGLSLLFVEDDLAKNLYSYTHLE